jgi:ribosomal protein S18 acetylase RimI-like enzyme
MPEATEIWGACAAAAATHGLTVRTAVRGDSAELRECHLRFEMEMAKWRSPGAEGPVYVSDGLSSGIRGIIEEEGGENIIVLSRELPDCKQSSICGFIYSYDEHGNDDEPGTGASGCAYIAEVYVERGERGKGLGEVLVSAALGAALGRGTTQVRLYVCSRNTAARSLYGKFGLRDAGGTSGDATHDLVMAARRLSSDVPLQVLRSRAGGAGGSDGGGGVGSRGAGAACRRSSRRRHAAARGLAEVDRNAPCLRPLRRERKRPRRAGEMGSEGGGAGDPPLAAPSPRPPAAPPQLPPPQVTQARRSSADSPVAHVRAQQAAPPPPPPPPDMPEPSQGRTKHTLLPAAEGAGGAAHGAPTPSLRPRGDAQRRISVSGMGLQPRAYADLVETMRHLSAGVVIGATRHR